MVDAPDSLARSRLGIRSFRNDDIAGNVTNEPGARLGDGESCISKLAGKRHRIDGVSSVLLPDCREEGMITLSEVLLHEDDAAPWPDHTSQFAGCDIEVVEVMHRIDSHYGVHRPGLHRQCLGRTRSYVNDGSAQRP